jgi:hypothetical protein
MATRQRTNRQTNVHKTQDRKLQIESHGPHYKPVMKFAVGFCCLNCYNKGKTIVSDKYLIALCLYNCHFSFPTKICIKGMEAFSFLMILA